MGHGVRATLATAADGSERTLFEETFRSDRDLEWSQPLAPGVFTFRLGADRVDSRDTTAAEIEWSDLVFETRAPTPPAPWPLPVATALDAFLEAQPKNSPSAARRRLLVIGIDGASWARMARLFDSGELPNLAALRQRGRWGVLASTFVPESAMSWTAIHTGVGPGGNGVFSFDQRDTARRSTWHFLGDRNLRSIVLAVPDSSPQQALKGILVAGWNYEWEEAFTQPVDLRAPLLRTGYRPNTHFLRNPGLFFAHMQLRTEIAGLLLQRLDWDHAFVVYEYSDTAGHLLHLETPEWDEVHRGVDELVGQLLDTVPPDTTVLVISDHGWRRYPRRMNVGTWLRLAGFSDLVGSHPDSANVLAISTREGAAPPDLETLRRVREGLLALRDPDNHVHPVQRVLRPQEIFDGPFTSPPEVQLMVELDLRYFASRGDREAVFEDGPVEHHDPEGIYLLAGPGVPAGGGPRASVMDIAPTVLAFYGVPAPADLEGKPLWDFGIAATGLPGAAYFESRDPSRGTAPTREVSPGIEENLRALGYID
jgi:predicted AlkP superfamily phosphohydrolase/phosphomutase